MAALERVSQEREREKLAFCRDQNVSERFSEQITYSFQYDLSIEVYLKGSDIPFEGIVYRIDSVSFILVENSGKIARIKLEEVQALRWQKDAPDPKVIEYINQTQAGIVMNR